MNDETQPAGTTGSSKAILNAIVATILVLLGIWMTVADFSHPGDLLFQSSPGIVLAALFAGLMFLVLIVVAALPKRMIIGANLLLLARCAMGFPLNLVMNNTTASLMTTVAFLALSLAYLFMTVRQVKRARLQGRPWFRLKHSLIAGAAWLLMVVISLPVMVLGYVGAARSLLGNYVDISPGGVELVERVFEKGGQRVHLVGMMHIGDPVYYTTLKSRLRATPADGGKRLVLTEGVSDRNHILPHDFANGKTYERWAKLLGLETQKELGPTHPSRDESQDLSPGPGEARDPAVVWENADGDVSDMKEKHRELLIGMLKAMASANMAEILTSKAANASGEDLEDLMKNGLILSRNEVLMARFHELGADFSEVYIPWGAAHLPDIEKRLLALGYQQKDEARRPIVRFWK